MICIPSPLHARSRLEWYGDCVTSILYRVWGGRDPGGGFFFLPSFVSTGICHLFSFSLFLLFLGLDLEKANKDNDKF